MIFVLDFAVDHLWKNWLLCLAREPHKVHTIMGCQRPHANRDQSLSTLTVGASEKMANRRSG